jgi:hypothetical protein
VGQNIALFIDGGFFKFLGRFILINIVPFFLVFNLVMRRRRQLSGANYSELRLVSSEFQTVGILGYFVILSIFFFSIPVLQYLNTKPGYHILLVQPDGYTVFLIAFISFAMVVGSIYLKERRRWAYRLLLFISTLLVGYSFFAVLEFGFLAIVPVVLFCYLLYRLRKPSLRQEFRGHPRAINRQ